jgi:D-alanyl-D-alanine carboxypeptidase (penicillin-binding protein 5/6)
MKFRFYIGISLAVCLGLILSSSILMGFSYVSEKIDIELPKISFGSAEVVEYNEEKEISLEEHESYDTVVFWGDENGRYEKISENVSFPRVSAKAYLVADLHTGEIIVSKNRYEQYPIASLTKLMTALVSLKHQDQSEMVIISREATRAHGKQGGLTPGEEMSISNLMYPLLLESSNDAAEALALFEDRNVFLDQMNNMSTEIGLEDTFFDDPSGLSAHNVSTPNDLFELIRYIHQNNSSIFSITRQREYGSSGHKWFNNSKFRNDKRYYGGKNGYTDEANHTLISIFDLPLELEGKRRVAIILLQSENTERDTNNILLYLLKNIYYDSE